MLAEARNQWSFVRTEQRILKVLDFHELAGHAHSEENDSDIRVILHDDLLDSHLWLLVETDTAGLEIWSDEGS